LIAWGKTLQKAPSMRNTSLLYFLLSTFVIGGGYASAAEPDRKGLDFFEAKIRPMLVTHCYECHSAGASAKKKLKGGLLLDTREGCRVGGESGPAVVPGKPDESLLISALKHDSFEMPPKGKLPDELIAHFVKWVELGAPDPREGGMVVPSSQIDLDAGKKHWAFHPLSRPTPPTVKDAAWIRSPIDQFIRFRQEAVGVQPNNIADPRTLIRRAYFDLIGLPPSPEQVDQFVKDAEKDLPAAYDKLIDELLASKHYGERWARHWLDIARFAESNGYAFDGNRPNAWRYRDFVIDALNSDMPYDQFVRLQIAGDLIAKTNADSNAEAAEAVRTLAATGYLVAGPYTTQQTQKERERSRYEQLDDVVSTLGTSLLGLTVGCCRCHNHKFDPLPQHDYYRLAACFEEVGFSDTSVNMQPEAFRKAKAAFDADHEPLVSARTEYEKQKLPSLFDTWLAAQAEATPPTPVTLKMEPWSHIGPFAGESFENAFETAFAPEEKVDLKATDEEDALTWTPQPDWKDGEVHNPFTGDNSANYIYRVIDSPTAQSITLSLGSDDAIKVWLNGKEVLAKLIGRGAAAGQETVTADLKQGRNELLIKIVNGAGPSGFYFSATAQAPVELKAIGPWIHAGPFKAETYDIAFEKAYEPEMGVDLGQIFEDRDLHWAVQPEWKDGVAHNDKIKGDRSAHYLYRFIDVDQPQALSLSLGSDDGVKLWVNGREVLSKKVTRNTAAAGQETVTIQLAKGRNEILMKIVNNGGASGFYFAVSGSTAPKEIIDIFAIEAEKRTDPQKKKLVDWYKGFDLEWLRLNREVVRHEGKAPEPDLTKVFAAKVRGSTYQFGADTYKVYHLRRGNADNKEAEADAGFLRVLMRTEEEAQHWLAGESPEKPRPGRLGLADWISDVDHGAGNLLARVAVNRVWHHHFGRGIVATPSDFGTRGEAPSHPELLNWLAAQFVQEGWSLKPLHKLIMTSAAYMQAGEVTPSGKQHDPENLLLWRRNSRRLEAEIIRDSLLSVSGALDHTMHGQGTLTETSARRSIYFTVKRGQLIPMLILFDAPDAMQGIGSREESTVAPQALAMLNSPIIRGMAVKFAARVRPTPYVPIKEAIDQAYRTAFARPATSAEVANMEAFIAEQKKSRGDDATAEGLALRDFCHLILCMNEFVYID